MPELPEVETTRRGLEPYVKGMRVTKLKVLRRDLRQPIPANLEKTLTGKHIERIRRRAKYMLFDIEGGQVMLAHLGMSGTFTLIDEGNYKPRKHDHVLIWLSNGYILVFHDPRRFGLILLFPKRDEATHALLNHLGPEPLSNHFNTDVLSDALKKRNIPVKVALMDQQIVVGVGNIYASESLFLSKLDPRMKSSDASMHAESLVKSIREVLNAAIESGGSTLRDYVRSSGDAGYFQHCFNVYDRESEPCAACSEKIIRIVQAQRSTFFCPRCQSAKITRTASQKYNRNSSSRTKNAR